MVMLSWAVEKNRGPRQGARGSWHVPYGMGFFLAQLEHSRTNSAPLSSHQLYATASTKKIFYHVFYKGNQSVFQVATKSQKPNEYISILHIRNV